VNGIDTSVPVVVLGLADHGSLGIARSLGRWGVAVHGVHREPTPASRSRYFRRVHAWDGSVEGLPAFDGRPILVPTGDAAAMWVDDNADALAPRFLFPRQPAGLARSLSGKRGMHDLCLAHDVPTPATAFPQSRADVVDYDGPFPVMVKAIDNTSVERRGVERMAVAHDGDEALALYDRLEDPEQPNLMLQEYVPGGADSVWMFNGYFDEASDGLVGFTGRKLRQCPPATGSTSLGECVDNPDVDALTRRFMKALGYRGILDCGYRYDGRDGRYKLLDVNPRIGATFRLFVGADGLDVVRALYLDLTGQPVPVDRLQEGRRWVVESNDLVSFATSRDLGVGPWLRSFRGVQEAAWWAKDDLRPFAAIAGLTARRAARFARTRLSRLRPGRPGPRT
jgi:D-aspartate ligase